MNRLMCNVFLAVGLAMLAGCGGGGLAGLAPVEGVVTYQGKPLANAQVMFASQDTSAGRSATGVTDANGKFTMTTLISGDGVMPGEYKVAVTKYSVPEPSSTAAAPAGDASTDEKKVARNKNAKDGIKSLIPEKYAAPANSGLSASITPKGNKQLTFALTD